MSRSLLGALGKAAGAMFLVSCSASFDRAPGMITYHPVALSDGLSFQLARTSRGADDHFRERLDLCGREQGECVPVLEYEAGWLPSVALDGRVVRVAAVDRGVTLKRGSVTLDGTQYTIAFNPLPPPKNIAEADEYTRRFGINQSPSYVLSRQN